MHATPDLAEEISTLAPHDKRSLPTEVTETSAKILAIVFEYALNKIPDTSERFDAGMPKFLEVVGRFVVADAEVKMCLPAFPFKSANKEYKVLGALPDKAEELALARLNTMCKRIGGVYPPGAKLTIISDGLVYNDLVSTSDRETWAYGQALRAMAVAKGFKHIEFSRIRDLVNFPLPEKLEEITYVANATNFRRFLLNKYGKDDLDINHEIATNPDTNLTYRGYRRFLESDLKHIFPVGAGRSGSGYKRNIKYLAQAMLVRGNVSVVNPCPFPLPRKAVLVDRHRLSQPQPNTHFPTICVCPSIIPLASTSVALLATGEWVSAPKGDFEIDPKFELVYEDGQPSYFQEKPVPLTQLVESVHVEDAKVLRDSQQIGSDCQENGKIQVDSQHQLNGHHHVNDVHHTTSNPQRAAADSTYAHTQLHPDCRKFDTCWISREDMRKGEAFWRRNDRDIEEGVIGVLSTTCTDCKAPRFRDSRHVYLLTDRTIVHVDFNSSISHSHPDKKLWAIYCQRARRSVYKKSLLKARPRPCRAVVHAASKHYKVIVSSDGDHDHNISRTSEIDSGPGYMDDMLTLVCGTLRLSLLHGIRFLAVVRSSSSIETFRHLAIPGSSLTPTEPIIGKMVTVGFELTFASISNIFDQPQGYATLVVLMTIDLITIATCGDLRHHAAAQGFYIFGQDSLFYTVSVFIVDTISLQNTGHENALVNSRNLVTSWLAGPMTQVYLHEPGQRWASTTLSIVLPYVTLPLLGLLVSNPAKGQKQGLGQRHRPSRSTSQLLLYYGT
nr:spore wall maturation protein dit1 [Quercus suber]